MWKFKKEEIRLCKDCKWCIPNRLFSICSNPFITDDSDFFVNGKVSDTYNSCEWARKYDCGIKGKYWEPKEFYKP